MDPRMSSSALVDSEKMQGELNSVNIPMCTFR